MLYRNIKIKATGQWVNLLFSTEETTFTVKPSSHLKDIAKALGMTQASLEVIDSSGDQRTGTMLEIPIPNPPVDPDQVAYAAATDPEKLNIIAGKLDLI